MSAHTGVFLSVFAKVALVVLSAAATRTVAFQVPFHRGVPMVYDVWRGDGVEHALVTIVPIDSLHCFVARGGNLVGIRKADGVSIPLHPALPPSRNLDRVRGILFVTIRDPEGELRQGRILLP